MVYILFVVGFFLLIFGAEWLIEGSSKVAAKLGISPLIIGLTVVAFGTSLPELIVSLFSITNDAASLAVGNVLGSNIANTLLILGMTAIITPIYVRRVVVWREVIFNILASVVLLILVIGGPFLGDNTTGLSRVDGLILISYFVLFLIYTFRKHHLHALAQKNKPKKKSSVNLWFSGSQIIIGSVGLLLGGRWIVSGAIEISQLLGINEGFIGLTIIALGTSLPEMAASISAVRKKKVDIAIGNVLGSNLFNILWVLGLSATIVPIEFDEIEVISTALVTLAAVTLFALLVVGKRKHQLSKFEGGALLNFYLVYLLILYVLLTRL